MTGCYLSHVYTERSAAHFPCFPSLRQLFGATTYYSTTLATALSLATRMTASPCAYGSLLRIGAHVSQSHMHASFVMAGFLGHVCLANLPTLIFLNVLGQATRLPLLWQIFPIPLGHCRFSRASVYRGRFPYLEYFWHFFSRPRSPQ